MGTMAQDKKKEQPPVDNVISDETGQFDLRFVLWRHFCSTNNIPVESLPSQLDDEQKRIVVETLARLLLKATRTGKHQEQTND